MLQAFFGVAVSFFCHGFCAPAQRSTFIFLAKHKADK